MVMAFLFGAPLHAASNGVTITSADVGTLTLTAGASFSHTFTASGTATWSIREQPFSGTTNDCTAGIGSTNHAAGLHLSSTSGTTATTLTWSRFFSRGQAGKHCLVVRACGGALNQCDQDDFIVNVVKPESPASLEMNPMTFGVADTHPLIIPFYAYNTRVDFASSADELIELVSCSSGNTCSPPTLPPWIGLTTTDAFGNDGAFITAQPPAGTLGDWTFKARVSQTVEGEDNDTSAGANPLASGVPLRASLLNGADVDFFRYNVLANQPVTVRTSSDGGTGCSSIDTAIEVFSADGQTQLASADDNRTNTCASVTYTPTTAGANFVRVRQGGSLFFGISSYFVEVTTPSTVPTVSQTWTLHVVQPPGGLNFVGAPSWSADATVASGQTYGPFTDTCSVDSDCTNVGLDACDSGMCQRQLTYGSCDGFDAWHLDNFSSNTRFYSQTSYAGTVTDPSPNCSGSSADYAPDGTNACRRLTESDGGANFTMVDTPEGTVFGANPARNNFTFPFAIITRQIAHLFAHQDDRALTSAVDDDTSTSFSTSSFLFVRGANDLFYDPYGECAAEQTYPNRDCKEPQNFGFNGNPDLESSKPTCDVSETFGPARGPQTSRYREGQVVTFDLTRLNALGTLSVARCSSALDTTCTTALPSVAPTVSSAGEFRWDIPYDLVSTSATTFWRLRSAASPDPNGDFYLVLPVLNAPTPPSGADLYVREMREEKPLAHIDYEPRLFVQAHMNDFRQTNTQFPYKQYVTNLDLGRSLPIGGSVQVHPLFEEGIELGADPKGPTTFQVEIKNGGGTAANAAVVDVYLAPALLDSVGRFNATPPNLASDPIYESVDLPALAAGASAVVEVPVNAADAILSPGAEPWEGGASAIFLAIDGNDADSSNDLYGPIFLRPGSQPVISPTSCPFTPPPGIAGTAGCDDVYGSINAVSPSTPHSGDNVTVNVAVSYSGLGSSASNVVMRYFKDLATAPTTSTTCTSSNCEALTDTSVPAGTSGPVGFNFTARLTNIQKPAASDDAFNSWVVIDATDVITETGGNEGNNVLPGVTPFKLVIHNSAPAVTNVSSTSATEDVVYAPTVTVSEPDQVDRAGLVFSLPTKPTGMTISSGSTCGSNVCATLSWTPTDAQAAAGTQAVQVKVCDQDPVDPLCATHDFAVSVTRVNDAPVVTLGSPPSTATEGTQYSHTLSATDEEGPVTWSITGQPAGGGATLTSATGSSTTVLWTPDDAAVAATAGVLSTTITVTATDNGTPSPTKTSSGVITIDTVTNVNDAPVLGAASNTSATEDATFTSDLNFGDADVDTAGIAQTLTCSAGSGSPSWATVSLVSGPRRCRITGSPGDADVGTSTVKVEASDGVTTTTVDVAVDVANINDAPVLGAPSATTATEDGAFTSDLAFSDADVDVSGLTQTLTCAFNGGHPAWLSVALVGSGGSRACELTGTPGDGDITSGTSVTIDASDGIATASRSFSLKVNNINDAPVLGAASNTTATEDAPFSSTLAVSDADIDVSGIAQTLTCSLGGTPPAWLSVSTQTVPSNACVLSGTPGDADVPTSPVTVTVQVSDGTDSDSAGVDITIANVNDAPVLGAPSSTAATEGSGFVSDLSFSDADVDVSGLAQTLTCALSGTPPSWLSVTRVDTPTRRCRVTGTPDDADLPSSGTTITVVASDGTASDSQSFAVTITNVNDAPVLGAPSTTAATEDAPFSSTLSFGDADVDAGGLSQTLTCSKQSGPAWVSVTRQDTPTRACKLSGTPTNSDVTSAVAVTVAASDGIATTTSTFDLSVENVNDAPVITAVNGQSPGSTLSFNVDEGQTLAFAVAAVDVDVGDTITFSFDAAPTFSDASLDPATGDFTLNAGFDESGSYVVTFVVTDVDGEADSVDVGIDVNEVNRAPVFSSTPSTSVDEDTTFSYDADATDPDGQAVTFSLAAAPGGMTIDGVSGLLTWVPQNADVGPHTVTVRASDGAAHTDQTFTLTVVNVNDAPVFTSTPPTSATEGVPLSYTATAADVDVGASLTFAATTLPSWLSFDTGTHVLSGTPDDPDVGDNDVVLTVSDGIAAPVEQSFTVTVQNVNDAPTFTATPGAAVTVAEGAVLTFDLDASDPDGPSALSFSMLSQPTGSSLDAASGVFSWTPGFSDAGVRSVTLQVTDGVATTQQALTITVTNTDRPPTCAVSPTSAVVDEGATVTLNVTGVDLDGDAVTLSSVSLPAGSSFTAATGVFSWTPGFADAGGAVASFRASAGGVDSVACSASITVNDVNQAPVLGAPSSTSATQGQLFQATLTASDVDLATAPSGEVLTFSRQSPSPSSMTVTKLDATTVRLDWTPAANEVGTQTVTIRVTDHLGLTDERSFNVTVANVNDAPVFTSTAPTAATEDSAFSYTATASDADQFLGDTLTFSVVGALPGWLTFNASTHVLSGTPRQADVGAAGNAVTLRVTDGQGAQVDQSFTLNVANVNDAPVLDAIGNKSVNEQELLTFTVTASDEDGTTPTLSASPLPSGATFNATSGVFSWTPSSSQSGLFNVTFTASDGALSDSEVVQIAVGNVDRPPAIAPIGDKSVDEGAPLTISVTATDPDGDAVTLSAAGLAGSDPFLRGATFSSSPGSGAGTFSWTPSFTDAGTFVVTFTASANGATDEEVVVITVADVNRAPVFTSPPTPTTDLSGSEGALLTFDMDATDADGDALGFDVSPLPSGATVDASTGVFSWTPSFTQAGTVNVTLSVTDGKDTTTRAIALVVANTDRAPTVTAPASQTVAEGGTLSFTVTGADADGDTVTLGAVSLPSGASFNASTGAFSFTPSFAQQGTTSATFRAAAGGLTTDATTSITVTNVNQPPALAAPASTSATQGVLFSQTLDATDGDLAAPGDTLTFTKQSGPAALTVTQVDADTARVDWTPGPGDVNPPSVQVVVRVTDAAGASFDRSFTVTVQNVNDAPVLAQPADGSVTQGQTFNATLSATDADRDAGLSDALTFTLPTAPAGMTVDGATGAVTWVTGASDVGAHGVTARVTDASGAFDERSFTVTVIDVNDPPVFASAAPTAGTQGALFSYTPTASDPDTGDTLTFSAPVLPAWLTFNAATHVLSGTPGQADVGPSSVTLRVTDAGGLFASQSFVVDVADVNDAPVLAPIGPKSVAEGATLTFNVTATDPDGTAPTLSATGLPPGASFTAATGVFSWATGFGDAGSFDVTFTASDGALSDSEVVTISVGDVNRAPSLTAIGDKSVDEGATLTFTVNASDPDVGDALTFSATGGVLDPFAAGATFNAATRAFSFSPSFAAAGVYHATFKVTDAGGLFAQETIAVTVVDVNRAPVFTATPPTITNEDAPFSYTAAASDPDGDALSWSLDTAPAGMTVAALTGVLSYAPQNADVGDHAVSVRVQDGRGGSATQSFTLTVVNTNDPPTFTSTPPTTATEDVPYAYTAAAADVDAGAVLTFSAPTLPSFLTFNAATHVLSGTPGEGVSGAQAVVLRVTDDAGASVDQSFSVTVTPVNDPPVLVAPTPSGTLTVAEGATLTFTIAATDVDSPTLTYGVSGLPAGASIDAQSGVFTWTPGFDDAGAHAMTLFADDGAATATRAVTVDVQNTDRPPVITVPGAQSVNEGATLSFAVSAGDPDGDAVTLTLASGPGALAAGVYSYSPGFDEAGAQTASFHAVSGGLSADASVPITVVDVNRAPLFTSTPGTTATEGQLFSYAITTSDPDGDAVTVTLQSGPTGVTIAAGALSWTPSGSQTGPQVFTLLASDGRGGTVTQSFTVDVTAVNDPPVFTSSPVTTAVEDQQYAYTARATDPDGDPITFAVVSGPAGLTVGATTGQVLYTPQNADVGDHAVTLSASDPNGGSATQSFTITVSNVNDAPVILANPAPPATVLQDATFDWQPAVQDVDVGDSVTLSITTGPPGMTVSAGHVTWVPGNDDVGDHPVTVRAQDLAGAFATRSFTVTVVNKNDAPFFTSAPVSTTVAEGDVFVTTLFADDIDVGDSLIFSLLGAPGAATLLPSADGSIVLRFAPDDPEVGDVSFTLRVEDAAGAFADLPVHFTVTPVNDAPVLSPVGNQSADVGSELVISLAATDADGDPLTFSDQNAPAASTLNAGVFRWTPGVGDVGAVDVTFTVSDGVLTDSETITIVVGGGPVPPSLVVPADAVVDEGVRLSATVTATDPNTPPSTVTLSATDLPPGATFSTTAGVFEWIPTFDQAGGYTVTFTATANGVATSRTWNVTVRDVNRAPTANPALFASATEGTELVLPLEASDPDGDTLTFAEVSGPAGVTFDAAGALHFTPAFADVGLRTVRVRVSDTSGASVVIDVTVVTAFKDEDADGLPDTWEIQFGLDPTQPDPPDPDGDGIVNLDEFLGGTDPFVSNAPTPPALLAPADGLHVATATPTLSWRGSSDPDGDPVTYSVIVFAAGGSPDAPLERVDGLVTDADDTGSYTVTTQLAENGTFSWLVIATDGRGNTPSVETRDFFVDVVNDPPPAPTLLEPLDGEVVTVASPTFVVGGVVDPDGDEVFYRFRLRAFPGDTPVATSELVPAVNGLATFTLTSVLPDQSAWFWDVESVDARGLAGGVGGPSRFTVDLLNQPPPAPEILAPADGEVVTVSDPLLRAGEVADPEGLAVTYRVELDSTPLFAPLTTQVFTDLTASGGEVSLQPGTLVDGTYHWRIRASDGSTFSEASSASFVVDTLNEPPPAPPLVAPLDNSLVQAPVSLVAQTVVDVEGAALTYTFEVSDAVSGDVVASVPGVVDADDGAVDGSVSVDVSDGLVPGARYAWRVFAVEAGGLSSAPGEERHFRLVSDNQRPLAPRLVSPLVNEIVTTATPVLRFEEPVDPDGDAVTSEVDVFSGSALVFHAGPLGASAGVVEVTLPALADGAYTWRARGSDLAGPGPFASSTFTVAAAAEGEGEGEGDVGEGEGEGEGDVGEGEGEGEGDDGSPIVTDVGAKLKIAPPSCGCTGGGGGSEAAVALVALLALLRRRPSSAALRHSRRDGVRR